MPPAPPPSTTSLLPPPFSSGLPSSGSQLAQLLGGYDVSLMLHDNPMKAIGGALRIRRPVACRRASLPRFFEASSVRRPDIPRRFDPTSPFRIAPDVYSRGAQLASARGHQSS